MIGYTTIGTNNLDAALKFYDEVFGQLGGKRVMDLSHGQLYGFAQGPLFGVLTPFDGKKAFAGNGNMIALNAGTQEKAKALHDLVLKLGGSDEGAPGPRGGSFYGAYARDPDGNKLCFFVMS